MTTSSRLGAPAPTTIDWDFGDFPYGLEPLSLPPVSVVENGHGVPFSTINLAELEVAYDQFRTIVAHGHTCPTGPVDDPAMEQLFWFRWITGHQVTFIVWQVIARLVGTVPDDETPDARTLAKLASCVSGYSAMLLYTGSCPRPLYESSIRPRMALQHRAFSGAWAPDYRLVRKLFRGRTVPWLQAPNAAVLRAAIDTNKTVHDCIAEILVPAGGSLLRMALAEAPIRPSEHKAALYDTFFLTVREHVADKHVVAQLLHRLKAIALDIATNGLYPFGLTRPAELSRHEIIACEEGITETLRTVAEVALLATR
jgi:L-tyrosine peroxygenase